MYPIVKYVTVLKCVKGSGLFITKLFTIIILPVIPPQFQTFKAMDTNIISQRSTTLNHKATSEIYPNQFPSVKGKKNFYIVGSLIIVKQPVLVIC